ncbi:MAG: Holliday junction branch migration protein RuvA [Clostridia bacterium]|nr:Holliday junction branch migration protein RuvA [Clostridia bacterium]
MYHHLRGILDSAGPGWAVVDCGGVGYYAGVSSNTYRSLPALGEKVKLLTHYVVREDAAELYGFLTQEELDCFRSMISVSGVGPKAALAILSELTHDRFAAAVSAGDYKLLTLANGVGPKLAQRIVLELKGKLGDISELVGGDVPQVRGNKAEAAQALEALGMKPREAAAAVASLDGDMTVEQLIAAALGKR